MPSPTQQVSTMGSALEPNVFGGLYPRLEGLHMSERPLCPDYGRHMKFNRALDPASGEPDDVNVYTCAHCEVSYITEDELPIAGARVH